MLMETRCCQKNFALHKYPLDEFLYRLLLAQIATKKFPTLTETKKKMLARCSAKIGLTKTQSIF